MKLFIFAMALVLQIGTATPTIAPPPDVQNKVTPILDLCARAQTADGNRQNELIFQYGRMLGELFQTKTRSSDEALVVLMNFYVGESLGEDLIHQITVRGKRMLPLLLKYREAHLTFSQTKYPSSLLLAAGVRKENFDEAIKSVKAGKIIGED